MRKIIRITRIISNCLLLTFLSHVNAIAAILHVPLDFVTIQAAVDVSQNGDTIMVADGTYSGAGFYNITFNGRAITVESENGPENCILQGEGAYSYSQYAGFVFENGETTESKVSGFTIRWMGSMGGLYCDNASPEIDNCLIEENWVWSSGGTEGFGIYCVNAAPVIRNCTITSQVGMVYGAGIYLDRSSPHIQNCRIEGNGLSAPGNGQYVSYGAGMACLRGSSPTISNCLFVDNHANGLLGGNGGALALFDASNAIVTNCVFLDNTCNGEDGAGGAIYIRSASPQFINCTIYNTQTLSGQAVEFYTHDGGNTTFNNGIIWGQSPTAMASFGSNLDVTYSCVRGWVSGVGNIFIDPLLKNPTGHDYHLSENSPCIDSGISTGAPSSDIDGDERPFGNDVDMGADEAKVSTSDDSGDFGSNNDSGGGGCFIGNILGSRS